MVGILDRIEKLCCGVTIYYQNNTVAKEGVIFPQIFISDQCISRGNLKNAKTKIYIFTFPQNLLPATLIDMMKAFLMIASVFMITSMLQPLDVL